MVPAKKKKLPALLRFSLLHFLFLFKKNKGVYLLPILSCFFFSRERFTYFVYKKRQTKTIFFSSSQSFRYPKGWIVCGRKASFADSKLFAHLRCCFREMSECFIRTLTSVGQFWPIEI